MAEAFHRHRFVGDGDAGVARGFERARELQAAEQLRRERAPQAVARADEEFDQVLPAAVPIRFYGFIDGEGELAVPNLEA